MLFLGGQWCGVKSNLEVHGLQSEYSSSLAHLKVTTSPVNIGGLPTLVCPRLPHLSTFEFKQSTSFETSQPLRTVIPYHRQTIQCSARISHYPNPNPNAAYEISRLTSQARNIPKWQTIYAQRQGQAIPPAAARSAVAKIRSVSFVLLPISLPMLGASSPYRLPRL